MKTIAVTGSSGFIGSRVVLKLKELELDVIELDILSGIDLTDWKQAQSTQRFDVLFHLAARSFVPDSYRYPRNYYYTNIVNTINALELCRIHEAKMIFVSSYVYGIPQYLPIDEKHPISALNPYAQSKIIGEQLCRGYNRDFGVKVIILRPFNIYGAGQSGNFLVPTIIEQAKSGKIKLQDPNPKRDMVYIDDVIDIFSKMIDYESDYDIFNIGSGVSYSVREIADIVCDLYGGKISVEYEGQERKNEVMETIADINKVRKLLDWAPRISIQQGLSEMVISMKCFQ